MIGGRSVYKEIMRSVETYDSEDKKWRSISPFPVPIMLASGISIRDQLFVVGGVTGTLEYPKAVREIYIYNDSR